MFLDRSGNLYFADTNHNLIRELIPSAASPVTSVSPTVAPLAVVNPRASCQGQWRREKL
jgi:hypothetical protein